MIKENLESLLNSLLGNYEVSSFSIDWILRCPKATQNSVQKIYQFLRKRGLSNRKIASQARLLGRNFETLKRDYLALRELGLSKNKIALRAELLSITSETTKRNYLALRKLGLSKRKILSNAGLLGLDPESVKRRYERLKQIGLTDKKILSQAQLLGMKTKTIEKHYQTLYRLGLSDRKIASQAQLLGMKTKTIKRNYQHHVGLLRQDYKDRNSGKDLLFSQAQLLGTSPETMEANILYLSNIHIPYNNGNGILLGTKPSTKRKKIAWMLRELFSYREIPQKERKKAIDNLYDFVRANSCLLTRSINYLEESKDALKNRTKEYRK